MRSSGHLSIRDDDPTGASSASASWVGAPPPSGGLRMYLDVLSARLPLIALIVAIVVGAAILFVAQSDKVYRAEADLLITPVPRNNANLFGLGLVTETGDPTRDAETLSQLITTPNVAERVRTALGVDASVGALLKAVRAEPVAQSSIVTVIAEANDPEFSAQLANAFASAAIDVRTERLRELLDNLLPSLRAQLAAVPPGETSAREALSTRLRELQSLRLLPDPTLHLETAAAAPNSPVAPRPVLTIVAALIGGLILAVGVVLGAHLLDPRVEREDDLRRYHIPVIARIPDDPSQGRRRSLRRPLSRRGPLPPAELSPSTLDAFRRLGMVLVARRDSLEPTIFVTSPGPSDGKTTTSFNLATAFAALGDSVVLVDADVRRPSVSGMLRSQPVHGLTDVLEGRAALADALLTPYVTVPGFEVLAEMSNGGPSPLAISTESAAALLRDSKLAARWVVVDGPALNFAPEALPLAKLIANVVIVVRLRGSRMRDLADLADLLSQQGIMPSGFIVVGSKPQPVYARAASPQPQQQPQPQAQPQPQWVPQPQPPQPQPQPQWETPVQHVNDAAAPRKVAPRRQAQAQRQAQPQAPGPASVDETGERRWHG